MTALEFASRPAAERKLIDEVTRLRELVGMLQRWLQNSERSCDLVRRERDRLRRRLNLSSDWDTAESVREKYDARHELEEVEA